ncbi:hypothetical protein [Kitasatospora sp. NPDC004289]
MLNRLLNLITESAVARATATLRFDLDAVLEHRNALAEQLVAARQRIDELEAAAAAAPVEPELVPDPSWDRFVKAGH